MEHETNEDPSLLRSAFDSSRLSFGDTVVVRATQITESRGLAGRVGQIWGQTLISSSGLADEVIGRTNEDYAINVFFDELDQDFWFIDDLLEFAGD